MQDIKKLENIMKIEDKEELDDEEIDDFYLNVEPESSLWKQILILHTRVVWKNFIIISSVILQLQLILYDISFRGRTAFPPQLNDLANGKLGMDVIYIFDVLSAIIYKKLTNLAATYGQPARSIISLIIDVISILPIDWIYKSATNNENLRVSYLLSTNRLLRVHRLFSFFNSTRNSVGQRTVFIRILEFLVVIFLLTAVAVAMMIHTVDMVNLDLGWLEIIRQRSSYPKSEFEWCIVSYYVMISQISGHGLPEAYPGTYSFAFILIVLVSLWILQSFEVAYLTDIILQQDYNQSLFHREMHLIQKCLDDMDASKEMKEKVKQYYNYFWKNQSNSEFEITEFGMYPSIFLKECALELTWDAYKHSHLFRDQPIPFLRDLAVLFEREYYRPGEVIVSKYEEKSKLIYVVSGVVQFLSEEDDKSPIMNFSGGTMLCESTLILGHRSLCNVIAGTEVELNVLNRDKFVELMVYKHRTIYSIIQSRVRLRYWKALRMVTIGAALQKNESHIVSVPACTDVAWLKQTLMVLENRQNRVIGKKEKKDIQYDAVFTDTDFRYTFENLDMLVISDNIATMTEQVCLNNGKLPWVFHPQSAVLHYWEGFVLVCCFALSLIIPAYVIQPKLQATGITFFLNILCPVYIIDFIITSSTAIHENDVVHTEIINIISRRMHNLSYWTDLVAAFPADWIFIVFGSHNLRILGYCRMNKLVKIYKFEGFFLMLENRMILSSFKIRVIKYTFYIAMLTYLSSTCILLVTCPEGKCEESGWLQSFISNSNEDMQGMVVTSAFLYASQILIGIGTDVIFPRSVLEYFMTIPLLVVGAAVFNYIISSVTASQIFDGFTRSWLRFDTINIALMLELNKVSKPIQARVFRYLEMQWLENDAFVLIFGRQIFSTMTPKLRKELRVERLASLIRKIDLFYEMEEDCVREICSVCKPSLLPPQEVLGYRGNECGAMYIVEKGHCQVWRNVDATPTDLTSGKTVYVLEMLFNLRNSHTVTTVTHVSIVEILLKDLMRVLSQYPMEKTALMKSMKKFKTSDEFSKLLTMQSALPRRNMTKEIERKWKEINEPLEAKEGPWSQNLKKKKKKKNKKTFESETRSWRQTVLMLFLVKSTINPDGRFIKIWEWIRCTCAYLLVTIYSAHSVLAQTIPDSFLMTTTLALNLTMVVDLYMRLHVQFYNDHKILVTHPLSTAINYIKNGLVVDVVGVFPLERFIISEDSGNAQKLFFCRLNRLVMMHRMISGIRHHHSWPYTSRYMKCVMFLPIIVLTGHVFACGLLLELCEVGGDVQKSEIFGSGIYCSPKNVKVEYNVKNPISPMEMYTYSLLYVLATLTRIGAVNLRPARYAAVLAVLVVTLMTFLILVVVTTFIVSVISRRDVTLTAYQEQMMILISYLKEKKVSTELGDEVVNYFENFWLLRRGTSIVKQMQLFPSGLREDVLWCVYGPSLTKSPGFSKRHESFFRSLFSRIDVKFFSKGSEIMTVNLVHNRVYFIHIGWAEVFGPDGTKIAVLGSGSIFGNFTGSSTMRQTCSIVTRTHMEAVVIESMDFFNLMMRHPGTKQSFLSAMALGTDYLRAETDAEEVVVEGQTQKKSSGFVLLPNTVLVETWDLFSVLVGCYLPFAVCLYHLAVVHFPGYWQLFLYIPDLAFLLKIGVVFFTAFEDDLGDYVMDKTSIAKRFRESRFGLYLHLFMITPFELFCLFVDDDDVRMDVLPWLRLNRATRVILVVNYFRTACDRLNIKTSGKRILYVMVWLISLLHAAACLTIISERATSDETGLTEGIRIYVEKFYAVSLMFAGISPNLVPENSQEALQLVVTFLGFYAAHAVLVGEVCAVVDVNQFVMNEYERRIIFFKDRVTRMDLTQVLRTNAWSYVSKLWKFRSGQQTPRLIKEAPKYLRYAVFNEIYGHHLLNSEVFGKLHEDLIRQLSFHFKENLFFPGDTIVNIGDIDETMYFVDTGTVHVSIPESNMAHQENQPPVLTLGPGKSFGVVQGLYEKIPHTATYTAETTTHIVYLNRLDWIYLLKYFPVSTVKLYKEATRIVRDNGLEAYI